MASHSNRRSFLKTTALLAGSAAAPGILTGQAKAPSRLLNVAAIGCGGKGAGDIDQISAGNRILALCDVDEQQAAAARAKFPDARFFRDFRAMFAELAEQIDVVTVSTPDHMHFPIAVEAIKRGKPVMVQKPLSNFLGETRALSSLAAKHGVLTVMGNQGATMAGTRLLREWIDAGLIGEVTDVHYWTNRPIWPQGAGLEFPAEPVPPELSWDLWQGTVATPRAYSRKIHPFAWRGFWDYGCGALGDIGCHSFNSAFWALDLHGDFTVECLESTAGDAVTAPQRTRIVYDFPAKGTRRGVKIHWQDGISDPNRDAEFKRPPGIPADLELDAAFGQVFVGTEGAIYIPDCYGSATPALFPEARRPDARKVKRKFERVIGGPTQELCRAIRQEGPKPVSNFIDHAGPLTEMVLAGNLAVRIGKKIDWDSQTLAVRGLPDAAAFIHRTYRDGWKPEL